MSVDTTVFVVVKIIEAAPPADLTRVPDLIKLTLEEARTAVEQVRLTLSLRLADEGRAARLDGRGLDGNRNG